MLVDSNILIYATKPEHTKLRQWLVDTLPKASVISKVEILGYHKLHTAEKAALTELLNSLELIYLTHASYEIASNYASNANSRSVTPSSPPPVLNGDIRWRQAMLVTSHGLRS